MINYKELNTLGIISAVIATIAVTGTLFLMYGEFPIIIIIIFGGCQRECGLPRRFKVTAC